MPRLLAVSLWVLSCAPSESPPLATTGVVSGAVHVPPGLAGDAWVMLFHPGEGPPGSPAVPVAASVVSAERLERGDARFVISNVKPNPWRLWGGLDVDQNFDLRIDVLAQPTAGDRVPSQAIEVNAQPSRGASADLTLDRLVTTEPPAFVVDTPGTDLLLDVSASGTTTLTLLADALGHFDRDRTAFTLGLVDDDHDGRPDSSADGTPTLSLTFVLHWLPRPGQLDEGQVVIPLVFNPAPFLGVLQGRLEVQVVADRLQLAMLPLAQLLGADGSRSNFGAPPVGDYELLAFAAGGQFWRVPNQLSSTLPSQGVRFHVDRRSP